MEGLAVSSVTNTYSGSDNTVTHFYGGAGKTAQRQKQTRKKTCSTKTKKCKLKDK